jgi:tetratricopeptide (TPR) repeat protein
VASTTERKARSRGNPSSRSGGGRRRAAELVDEADRLVGEYLEPGRWPHAKTVDRFLADGGLERLLSLYGQAMALDQSEPAYPWNLASTLRRLGQLELAAAFLKRAIHLGDEQGESDYSGAGAYLALAEIALERGDADEALVAIARAREPGRARPDTEAHAERLLHDLKRHDNGGTPLAELLAGPFGGNPGATPSRTS